MKTGLIITAVVALLGVAVFVLAGGGNDDAAERGPDASNIETEDELETYTFEQVAIHNNEDDCWLIIEAGVYDVTNFIPLHEGGDEILRGCGRDATDLFNTRTTEDGETIGSGTPHSSQARNILSQYKIGELATSQ